MENHHFVWENPLFLWPFSIAMLNYQRIYPINIPLNHYKIPLIHYKSPLNHHMLDHHIPNTRLEKMSVRPFSSATIISAGLASRQKATWHGTSRGPALVLGPWGETICFMTIIIYNNTIVP